LEVLSESIYDIFHLRLIAFHHVVGKGNLQRHCSAQNITFEKQQWVPTVQSFFNPFLELKKI
jgi:hypothetical protein